MMVISEQRLRCVVAEILRRGGSAEPEAKLVSDHLVEANLAGHDSHGVGMIPRYVDSLCNDLLKPNVAATLLSDNGGILVFDGGRGYGQRVAREATAAGIERCRQTGLALVALRGAHHIGRVGAYGEQAIDSGLVAVYFVNVIDHGPLVAPFGGRDARLSTNPFCVAVPGTDRTAPILLDMATSRIAFGKVKVAANQGRSVSDGSLIDAQGQATNDPRTMFSEPRAALCPVGGYKGSGLALICELLGGVLTGGGTMQPGNVRHGSIINNLLGVLIDPRRLVDDAWLGAEIDAIVAYLKASPPSDSERPVMVAGEPERRARSARRRTGIPIDETTWDEILTAGERLGLNRDAALDLARPATGRD